VRGVAGGADTGKIDAWLKDIGSVATIVGDVCVVVGT
jgi:hypothetical protein